MSRLLIVRAVADPALDAEIEGLLESVYVRGGFTPGAEAAELFAANAVRDRGDVLVVRDPGSGALSGMVIVVPPTSRARRLATAGEAEMHLLAVAPAHRGRGIGEALIDAAIRAATEDGRDGMVLWTQPSMRAAQRLYERAGFVRQPERDFERGNRRFLVFYRALSRCPNARR